ncbi:MAG: sensor histidine kinase [Rectinemataceae bacterium]
MNISKYRLVLGLMAMSAVAASWSLAAENIFTGREDSLEIKDFLLLESPRAERSHLDLSAATPGVLHYSGGHLPSDPSLRPKMYTFAATFRVDPSLAGSDMALYVGLAEYPLRVYLNGTEIFAEGRYTDGHYNSSLRAVQSVYLSPGLLRYGSGENTLVLEAYPRHENWGLDRIYVGRKAAVDSAVFLRNFVGINLIQGASVLVLIIGLYFLALFIFDRRNHIRYLIFSLMCASFCLSYFNVTVYYDADNEVLLEALSKGGLMLMSSFMLVFCWEFTSGLNRRRIFPLAVLAFGVAAAVLVMTRRSKEDILLWFGYAMNFLIVPQILFDIGILAYTLVAKKGRYVLPLLAAFSVIIVTAGSDVVHLNSSILPYAWFTAYGYFAVVAAIFAILVKEQAELVAANVRLKTELSEHSRAEEIAEKLCISEQLYRDLLERAADGIFLLDGNGSFVMVNSGICEMLGYAREELLGRSILDTYPDELRAEGRERSERINSGEKLRFERMMKRKDGSLFPVEMSAGRLADGSHQAIVRDITERKKNEELLRVSLAEKEVLIREIHHRVKNNMQVISSIISLQESSYRDETDRAKNRDTQMRIRSMAHLHELLYGSKNLSSIDIADYLRSIAGELSAGYFRGKASIRLEVQSDILPIDEAMPLGLIATELVSNALKYAYPGGTEGEILVSYGHSGQERRFEVRDEGVGLPPAQGCAGSESLGFTLVRALAEQIGGRLSMGAARVGEKFPGFSVVFVFPLPDRGQASRGEPLT